MAEGHDNATTMRFWYFCAWLCFAHPGFTQTFVKVTDNTNPIVTTNPTSGYAGASWVDYDGDGDIDLFVNQDFLFRNDGEGKFTRIMDSGIQGVSVEYNNGNGWADYDNDGDPDLILVNRNKNGLFRNNGNGTFTRIEEGDIAMNINAWSPAWADYDNDGWVDLMATHPCGFTGQPCHTNYFFHNNGDGTLSSVTNSPISTGFAAYTSANWSDFDQDGDMDLFIGSGEISSASKDHIYLNGLQETGEATFLRYQTGALFGDLRDGQNWNWIDYDNDGDFDGFVTNWKMEVPCDFYRNDGNGVFVRLTEEELGVPMTSQQGNWLANVWGDFNNDGWIDVIIGADNSGTNKCYTNNGDGTFSAVTTPFTNQRSSRGITCGDYDNDGDLDVFINASDLASKGLFRNRTDSGNWVLINLRGTLSNHSAIGARIRVLANISGTRFWQVREISAQNSFCGHNSQRVHFGLGNAIQIDSLVIEWPLGLREVYTNQSVNQILTFDEGSTSGLLSAATIVPLTVSPNPVASQLHLRFPHAGYRSISVYNASGVLMTTETIPRDVDSTVLTMTGLLPGIYWIRADAESAAALARIVKQ